MSHVSSKNKTKHEVAIFGNKHALGRHKGKGYMIATPLKIYLFVVNATEF